MTWNYRLVDLEGFLEIKEVYYEEDGSIFGYCSATAGGACAKDVKKELKQMKEAFKKPILIEREEKLFEE